MPTKAEQDELRIKCTWTWTTQNGVNGYKVTSKTNGNSIFLPASGFRGNSGLFNIGSAGYYWSRSPDEGNSEGAWYVDVDSNGVVRYSYPRYYGQSIRPVCP